MPANRRPSTISGEAPNTIPVSKGLFRSLNGDSRFTNAISADSKNGAISRNGHCGSLCWCAFRPTYRDSITSPPKTRRVLTGGGGGAGFDCGLDATCGLALGVQPLAEASRARNSRRPVNPEGGRPPDRGTMLPFDRDEKSFGPGIVSGRTASKRCCGVPPLCPRQSPETLSAGPPTTPPVRELPDDEEPSRRTPPPQYRRDYRLATRRETGWPYERRRQFQNGRYRSAAVRHGPT